MSRCKLDPLRVFLLPPLLRATSDGDWSAPRVASALPSIAADFGELAQLNWIVSAFNLTSAAFIPFWGQMADIFGRHAALQAATALMLVGSALCTAAPAPGAFWLFLLGRAVQGIGCAGISVVVRTVLADRVPL